VRADGRGKLARANTAAVRALLEGPETPPPVGIAG
jgi:hypothetical protein